jgi:hypothetical protein
MWTGADAGNDHVCKSLHMIPQGAINLAAPKTSMTDPSHLNHNITHTVEERLAKRPRKSYPKACHPCRCRKIRCNNAQPCSNCISHDYPELCYYATTERERKILQQRPRRTGTGASETKGTDPSPAGRLFRLLEFEKGLQGLGDLTSTEPAHSGQPDDCSRPRLESSEGVTPCLTTDSLEMTSDSSRRECTRDQRSDDHCMRPPGDSRALYMSDMGTIHPFENLWQPGSTVQEICLALPSDEVFTRYGCILFLIRAKRMGTLMASVQIFRHILRGLQSCDALLSNAGVRR